MVKNFIPNCDLCGSEIPLGRHAKRKVHLDSMELLLVALENDDPDLEFTANADGEVELDTCLDCYGRISFQHSEAVN